MSTSDSTASAITATRKPHIVEVLSLDDLARSSMIPHEFYFQLVENGDIHKLMVRALSDVEMAQADAFTAILPPALPGKPDEFNYMDETFRKEIAQKGKIRRAFIITKGLVNLVVPGGSLEEQDKTLREKFPPRIIDGIFDQIISLTSDELKVVNLANFFSEGGSPAS